MLDEKLNRALINAIKKKNIKKAKYLIDLGANVCEMVDGLLVLDVAKETNDEDVISFVKTKLVEEFKKVLDGKSYGDVIDALYSANKGRKNISKEEANKLGKRLLKAVDDNSLLEVKKLVSEGANLDLKDKNGTTALLKACFNDRIDMVNVLIKGGANVHIVDNQGWTCLMATGSVLVAKRLVEKGVDIEFRDDENNTALIVQAQNGKTDIVEYLIKVGANIDAQCEQGTTPLMEAIGERQWNTAELLVNEGANLDLKDVDGDNALSWGVLRENEKFVMDLIDKGGNVNNCDNKGLSLLMLAVDEKMIDLAKKIIDCGGDVNCKDKDKNTALMIAS